MQLDPMRCMRAVATGAGSAGLIDVSANDGQVCRPFGTLIAIPQNPHRLTVPPKKGPRAGPYSKSTAVTDLGLPSVCISTAIALKYRDPTMSSSSTQFHRIWIEQCAATEDIREAFGLKNALDYLIGEKLFTFLLISERDLAFAAELPAFVSPDLLRRGDSRVSRSSEAGEVSSTSGAGPGDR
jgi:hypothetical protein